MAASDPVEIKVNIAGDVDHALGILGLDGGKKREVWFFDDVTEGTRAALPLLSAGVVLRLRRRKNGEEDSTVKLRPCRRSQLIPPWHVAPTGDDEFRIEGDWSRGRHVLAASVESKFDSGVIKRVTKTGGRAVEAFTSRQQDFLTQCGDISVAFDGVSALGPIASTQWKDLSIGAHEVVAERWTVKGLDFLELSIRTESGAEHAVADQRSLTAEILSRGLDMDDSDEPKTTRVLRRLAGMD